VLIPPVLLLTALLAAPAPAPAQDGCISGAEFHALAPTSPTLRVVETRLGVTHAGRVVGTQHHGDVLIKQYRWCGHPASDGYFQIGFYARPSGSHRYVAQAISWFDFT